MSPEKKWWQIWKKRDQPAPMTISDIEKGRSDFISREIENVPPEIKKMMEELNRYYGEVPSEQVEVTPKLMLAVLMDGTITYQFHMLAINTVGDYLEVLAKKDYENFQEKAFLISHSQGDGIGASEMMGMPAFVDKKGDLKEFISKYPEKTDQGDGKRMMLIIVHSHPPIPDDPLKPSGYIETHNGPMGDLYGFLGERKLRKELGWKFTVDRPVAIIVKPEISEKAGKIKFMAIREKPNLARLPDEEYLVHLKEMERHLQDSKDEINTCKILDQHGYITWYEELPSSEYFSYPILSGEHIGDFIKKISK